MGKIKIKEDLLREESVFLTNLILYDILIFNLIVLILPFIFMLVEILKQINWVDVVIGIITLRIIYVASQKGFILEFFKSLGLVLSVYISFHYYTLLSDFLGELIPLIKTIFPLEFFDFWCFILLAVLGYFCGLGVRFIVSHFIKMEPVNWLNKWGGFLLGILRSLLFCSLVVYTLMISSISYFKESARNAYFSPFFIKIAPNTYYFVWDKLMSKFMSKETVNPTVDEVISSL